MIGFGHMKPNFNVVIEAIGSCFVVPFIFIPLHSSPLRKGSWLKKVPPSCLQWVICLTSTCNRSGRLMPVSRSELLTVSERRLSHQDSVREGVDMHNSCSCAVELPETSGDREEEKPAHPLART